MINIKLPFWISHTEIEKLRLAAVSWWDKVELWCGVALSQFDPLTCAIGIVDLLAYQRNITRGKAEAELLYRTRVKYAFNNASQSGEQAGFKAIFERIGIGTIETRERVDGYDWDVIILELSDSQLTQYGNVIDLLISEYGRTCRRYHLENNDNLTLLMGCVIADNEFDYCTASLNTIIDNRFSFYNTNGAMLNISAMAFYDTNNILIKTAFDDFVLADGTTISYQNNTWIRIN